ncbi:MAG: choice-of-anchor J domain-containing protein [Dehalococcoidia bacterium]
MIRLLRTVWPLVLIFALLAFAAPVSADGDILFEQAPSDASGSWSAYTSDPATGYVCMDDFSGVTADIGDVHWYGCDLIWDSFTPGDPSGMQFQITFYEDNAGSPGNVVDQFSDVVPAFTIYVDTGWIGYVYRFDFDLSRPVFLEAGWISIQSTSSLDNGSFLWWSSPDGTYNALQNECSIDDNLAFALTERSSVAVIPSMAAPNIAEIILEAEGLEANQSIGKGKNKTFINLIQLTAANMGPQTDFDGVSKYLLAGEPGEEVETLNPDYWQAVLDFLNEVITSNGLGIEPLTYSYADYVGDQNGGGSVFEEDFTDVYSGEIPAGWSRTMVDTSPNWYVDTSTYAGGTSPEMAFCWAPLLDGTSRLVTPLIDASTNSGLELTFKHAVDDYAGYDYALEVQVSTDGGSNWVDAWSINPTGNIGPETVTVDLSAYDGQTFQLAWVFDGNSWNIDYWYIDDISVTGN